MQKLKKVLLIASGAVLLSYMIFFLLYGTAFTVTYIFLNKPYNPLHLNDIRGSLAAISSMIAGFPGLVCLQIGLDIVK